MCWLVDWFGCVILYVFLSARLCAWRLFVFDVCVFDRSCVLELVGGVVGCLVGRSVAGRLVGRLVGWPVCVFV